jgi:DNA (cytosine-5)-methyltransferase 1
VASRTGKDTYSHIHHDSSQARSITPREAARLQSFPDAFQFEGNMGDMFRQIGNAVPPLLARELGAAVHAVLARIDGRPDGERPASGPCGSRTDIGALWSRSAAGSP